MLLHPFLSGIAALLIGSCANVAILTCRRLPSLSGIQTGRNENNLYPDPSVINVIVEIQKDGKNFLVGLYINSTYRGIAVNNIRTLFPKDLHEWLFWIDEGRTFYLDKEKVQNLIAQQRRNLADVSYLDLNSINNIIQNFQNPSVSEKNPEKTSGLKTSLPGDRGDTSLDPVG